MLSQKTTEQFIELIQKFICLRPRLVPPEHMVQFRKKMEALKGSGYSSEDHGFVFRILILLSHSQEPLAMGKLSAELNVPMSTATRIVDWLVNSGLVKRVNDPNDRRVVRIAISDNGREMYDAGVTQNKKRIGQLLKDFTPAERDQLLYLMEKILNSLSKEVVK
jgi:DNA-binding MarR family transcriptional regulator